MNNIYDNGELLLGTKKDILNYWENNAVDIDSDLEEEVKEELKNLKDDTIVCINYDNGMGYTIDYWDSKDIIKGGVETRGIENTNNTLIDFNDNIQSKMMYN